MEVTPGAIRRLVMEQCWRANVGSMGSALSIADIVAALYGHVLGSIDPADPDRDRVVLSKGHAALAVYAALHLRGLIGAGTLDSYCGQGSLLGNHPERELPGIDFTTGSLGHGLPMAAGAALAARMQGSCRRAFAIVSDAECNEGALWEAVMFAAHHRLANLVAVVDANGQQAFGYTRDVLCLSPLAARWRAFGWDVHEVGGHDAPGLAATIRGLDTASGPPHVLVAETVFGRGVSFMENRIEWHFHRMSEAQYEQAMAELAALP